MVHLIIQKLTTWDHHELSLERRPIVCKLCNDYKLNADLVYELDFI